MSSDCGAKTLQLQEWGKEAEAEGQARPETRDVSLKIGGGREERTSGALEILLTLYIPCLELILPEPMCTLISLSRVRKGG